MATSRSGPGNLPEHMDRDTGIGHPSKAGVAEVVTTQMLVAASWVTTLSQWVASRSTAVVIRPPRGPVKVVLVRANSLRPLEPPEAYKAVPRRVRGLDGQIRSR